MDPATASLILGLLLKYGPALAQQAVLLFHKKDITLEDWNALFASVKTYEQMDSESKIRTGIVSIPS